MTELAKKLSKIGHINKEGKCVYGTAAFLHYLRMFKYWDENRYDPQAIERGRIFVEKLLNNHSDRISKRVRELCS